MQGVRLGTYDHLNENDPLLITISYEDLAQRIIKANYGVQRFLSVLVKEAKESDPFWNEYDNILRHIETLLEKGYV